MVNSKGDEAPSSLRQHRKGTAKAASDEELSEFLVRPDPDDPALTEAVEGLDQDGAPVETRVVVERPLTLYLNRQEIVTMMTIGDHPDYLAVGYLLNQNMLHPDDVITGIDHDDDLEVVVVRTERETDYEEKLQKKVRTSGCAQGTVFGDLMEKFEQVALSREARIKTSWLAGLSRKINGAPSLYLEAGAIHGCVLCQEDRPLVYMEDVGRHNAVDKIAGYMLMNGITPEDKIFYTTGRLGRGPGASGGPDLDRAGEGQALHCAVRTRTDRLRCRRLCRRRPAPRAQGKPLGHG